MCLYNPLKGVILTWQLLLKTRSDFRNRCSQSEGRKRNGVPKMRKAFVDKLGKEDGVIQSWEFKVVGGDNTERLTVGMTVYENQENSKIGQATQTWAESAFFGTFDPVALQYAFSIK